MRQVFVDTSYLVALIDRSDGLHVRAAALTDELAEDGAAMITTDAVFFELANYFARGPLRGEAITWIDALRAAADWDVIALDRPLIRRGEGRYRRHDDKGWSLTDCVSMECMAARKIREAATSDAHFEQAGFVALLRR